jgi:hypothetical protein
MPDPSFTSSFLRESADILLGVDPASVGPALAIGMFAVVWVVLALMAWRFRPRPVRPRYV